MWKRAELKRRGRENFRKNYWPAAAVSLVLAVMMTNIGGPYLIRGEKYNLVSILWTDLLIPWKFQTGIGIVLIRDILYIFIFAVIEVGGAAFYIRNREEQAKAGLVFSGFFDGRYKKYMKGMFMMHLELFFWYLMLLVPGIIKSYAFRMVPYLLAEDPDLTFAERGDDARTEMESISSGCILPGMEGAYHIDSGNSRNLFYRPIHRCSECGAVRSAQGRAEGTIRRGQRSYWGSSRPS